MTGLLPFWRQATSLKTRNGQSNEKSVRLRQTAIDFFDPNDARIFYKFSERARRISLRVHPSDRQVTVIVPGERALPKAQKFVREKMDWINVQLEGLPQPQPFYDGAPILFAKRGRHWRRLRKSMLISLEKLLRKYLFAIAARGGGLVFPAAGKVIFPIHGG